MKSAHQILFGKMPGEFDQLRDFGIRDTEQFPIFDPRFDDEKMPQISHQFAGEGAQIITAGGEVIDDGEYLRAILRRERVGCAPEEGDADKPERGRHIL